MFEYISYPLLFLMLNKLPCFLIILLKNSPSSSVKRMKPNDKRDMNIGCAKRVCQLSRSPIGFAVFPSNQLECKRIKSHLISVLPQLLLSISLVEPLLQHIGLINEWAQITLIIITRYSSFGS